MLESFTDINNKSFSNYSLVNKNIGKINILFGVNGSGKSALSEWISEQNSENSKVFNSKYVYENIEDEEVISGVRLTVGKRAIENKAAIHNITIANENIAETNKLLMEEKISYKEELFEIMNTYLQEARNRFSLNKNIKQKANAAKDPIQALNSWKLEKDYDITELTHLDSSISLEREIEIVRRNKKLLEDLSKISNISKTEYNQLISILKNPVIIPKETISQTLNEWLAQGLNLHNMDKSTEQCRFCGNTFDGSLLTQEIENKINTEHVNTIKNLNTYKETLLDILEREDAIPQSIMELERTIFKEIVIDLINNINIKIDDSERKILIPSDYWNKLIDFNKKIINNLENSTQKLVKYENQSRDIETIAKGWIKQKLVNNDEANIIIPTAINQCKTKIEKNLNIIEKNEKWITEQQRLNSDLEPFAKIVNKQFQFLGLNLLLETNQEDNTYGIIHNTSKMRISAKSLSEGERRLLAFFHFYYDLFQEEETDSIKPEIRQVIIDDPITSLDVNNRYHLTELINNFIEQVKELDNLQLFIFTHSSMDFHNLGFFNRSSIRFWKISKNEHGNSEIKYIPESSIKNYSDYYHEVLIDIIKFTLTPNRKIDEIKNYIPFANKARFVLESHARSNYRINNVTGGEATINTLIEVYDITSEKEQRFKNTVNMINSLSHGITLYDIPVNEISAKELRNSIRIVIGILYKKDEYHIKKIAENSFFQEGMDTPSGLNRNQLSQIEQWY